MLKLTADNRTTFGRRLNQDRAAGRLPGIIYGAIDKPQPVMVNKVEFIKAWREAGESSVVTLQLAGQAREVLIYAVDWHPATNEPRHIDFYAVRQDQAVTVPVPLEFTGVAPAEKELGGTVVKVLHEVEIEALPKDLPHELLVDLSALNQLDSQILVSDISVPKGVIIKDDSEEVVAMISQAVEEETTATEPDLSEIEVEKKGKADSSDEEAETKSEGQKTD